jgi:hypothetical protein
MRATLTSRANKVSHHIVHRHCIFTTNTTAFLKKFLFPFLSPTLFLNFPFLHVLKSDEQIGFYVFWWFLPFDESPAAFLLKCVIFRNFFCDECFVQLHYLLLSFLVRVIKKANGRTETQKNENFSLQFSSFSKLFVEQWQKVILVIRDHFSLVRGSDRDVRVKKFTNLWRTWRYQRHRRTTWWSTDSTKLLSYPKTARFRGRVSF